MPRSRYYSQRVSSGGNLQETLGGPFFRAFLTVLERLAEQNYFCESFPSACGDGHPVYWDSGRICEALREAFGEFPWPYPENRVPTEKDVFDLVEFFYDHASKPTESWYHSWCGNLHPTKFDGRQGRYDYTVEVNNLFKRFNLPYELGKGNVRHRGSEVLDAHVRSLELATEDPHLRRLLDQALKHFREGSQEEKILGVRSLADAFERLKSIEDPSDKKRSAGLLINKVAGPFSAQFESIFRELTRISNEYTIRHHEKGKMELEYVPLIEYLFYSYYNLIRFLLPSFAADGDQAGKTAS